MEASLVLSSLRVAPRSLNRAARVSSMISSTVLASLVTGQVQLISPTVLNRTIRISIISGEVAGVNGVTGTNKSLSGTTARRCAK